MHAGGFARVLDSQTTGILESFSYPWPSLIVSCQAAALDDLTLCERAAKYHSILNMFLRQNMEA